MPRLTQKKIKQIPGPQIQTQPSPKSFGSGFVDSMVSGFGFGIGSSLARKMFEPKIPSEPQNPSLPAPALQPSLSTPDDIFKKYQECIERNELNCEQLINMKS